MFCEHILFSILKGVFLALLTVTLLVYSIKRDSVMRFFSVGFLHEIASPGTIRGTLGRFQFLPYTHGDI